MSLLVHSAHRPMASFAVGTLGCIFCIMSMGLAEWRVWHMDHTPLVPGGLACVGMWKVCIYRPSSYSKTHITCHLYRYTDAYPPPDIRAAQNLLLAASLLGLLGKELLALALRNVFVDSRHADAAQNLFLAAGTLKVAAGTCISVAVVCNYRSVTRAAGIAFPPSFALPFKPRAQDVGNASSVAVLAALMMLLSGLLSFFYKVPPESQVHPVVAEI
ncbi:claudin 34 [Phyllostomus discolor]|uniref:Claudin-34 n=1 Tax=Phyllostomus discolor TaxID=89673 RepID=A0A6J2L1M4_9CHIR|nr:claudin-34-like [Phyllostomus discolor]XP_028379212.1 claudin-34 [Phyllostomus discolor]KAF6072969.1 claudin 34 [Phyllostomus discolor]